MMRKIVFAVFLILISTFVSYSQDSSDEELFYFDSLEDKLDESELELDFIRGHYLGETIAKKLQLLQDAYTWVEPPTATAPVKQTMVEKPAIYYALKKLSNSYKKRIKKGEVTEGEALDQLTKALDIGLFIRYQNTQEFEDKLREFKSPNDIASLFTEKVQLK